MSDLPKGVWHNGCAFHDIKGRTFAPWGPFGRTWGPRKAEFPRTEAEARARMARDASGPDAFA